MAAFPSNILFKDETSPSDYFNYTASVAHLLSLVSGVDVRLIRSVSIFKRRWRRYIPWYSVFAGGGAITLGSRKKQSITFTENFFQEVNPMRNQNLKNIGTLEWLRLSAHEVIHINHAQHFGSLFIYLSVFIYQYIRYGHDEAPLEKEADFGQRKFDLFNQFINQKYALNKLIDLMDSDLSENEKISFINEWWLAFSKTNSIE